MATANSGIISGEWVGVLSAEKIILALDVEGFKEAEEFVRLLGGKVGVFKVGKKLFTRCGPKVVEMIHRHRGKVFLDLKFHDIPHTVAGAIKEACRLKVFMLTLHAMGGKKMMQEAVESAARMSHKLSIPSPLILAVSILTSLKKEDLNDIGISSPMEEAVLRLAKLANLAGVHGVIASAKETAMVKNNFGEDFIVVTPGIRPAGAALNDQKRAVTPKEAFLAGSDYLVIGRPILEAKDPLKVVEEIAAELKG